MLYPASLNKLPDSCSWARLGVDTQRLPDSIQGERTHARLVPSMFKRAFGPLRDHDVMGERWLALLTELQ